MNKQFKKLENNKISTLHLNNMTYINNNNINTIQNLQKKSITINNNINTNKNNENSFEFPPLAKDLNKLIKNKKNYNNKHCDHTINKHCDHTINKNCDHNINKICDHTVNTFYMKNKYHKSIREKAIYSNYKKINLKLYHRSTPFHLYNKKGKFYDRKIFLSEGKIKMPIKNIMKFPNNFPFTVQNSYYNSSTNNLKEKDCDSKKK